MSYYKLSVADLEGGAVARAPSFLPVVKSLIVFFRPQFWPKIGGVRPPFA